MSEPKNPLDVQVGGGHYNGMAIQPVEFIQANGLDFFQGNIIAYVCRHKAKNGAEDLRKAIHFAELAIELQYTRPEQDAKSAIEAISGHMAEAAGPNPDYVPPSRDFDIALLKKQLDFQATLDIARAATPAPNTIGSNLGLTIQVTRLDGGTEVHSGMSVGFNPNTNLVHISGHDVAVELREGDWATVFNVQGHALTVFHYHPAAPTAQPNVVARCQRQV